MTTSTQSLAGWLLERIAEDEAAVSGAAYVHMSGSLELASGRDLRLHWDRRRVLAECEAKREVIRDHGHMVTKWGTDACVRCNTRPGETPWPCRTLRLLALPYAGHPDYDPAWSHA